MSEQKANAERSVTALGYTVQLGSDGRRLWTPEFKEHVCKGIRAGTFTKTDVATSCQIGRSTIQDWLSKSKSNSVGKWENVTSTPTASAFSQMRVAVEDPDQQGTQIVLKSERCELRLPADFPARDLGLLIRTIEVGA